jgi:hypothetical protein
VAAIERVLGEEALRTRTSGAGRARRPAGGPWRTRGIGGGGECTWCIPGRGGLGRRRGRGSSASDSRRSRALCPTRPGGRHAPLAEVCRVDPFPSALTRSSGDDTGGPRLLAQGAEGDRMEIANPPAPLVRGRETHGPAVRTLDGGGLSHHEGRQPGRAPLAAHPELRCRTG